MLYNSEKSLLQKSFTCEDFKNCMVKKKFIDEYKLACCIKVPVNKNGILETLSKTRHQRYIPNCAVSILVTFRFSTSSNQRDQIKPLLL